MFIRARTFIALSTCHHSHHHDQSIEKDRRTGEKTKEMKQTKDCGLVLVLVHVHAEKKKNANMTSKLKCKDNAEERKRKKKNKEKNIGR